MTVLARILHALSVCLLLAATARAADPPARSAPAASEAQAPAPGRYKFKSGRFWHVPRLPVPPRR